MPIDLHPPPKSREASQGERIELLASTIDECGRRLRFGTLLYRLLYVIAGTVLFPLLVVIGDHAIAGGLPRVAVFGAGILWVIVTILAALGVSVRTVLRPFNRLFLARHVEQSRGIPHNPLINLVLLQRGEESDYASDAARRQALKVLSSSGPDESGGGVPLRSPGLFLLTTIGVWIIYAAITPKPILPSLARLFGADRDAPTATRIELLRPRPGEPVYVGEPLEVEFAVSGHSVAQVTFNLLDPAQLDGPPLLSNSLTRAARSESGDRYATLLAAHEVSGDLHYRCVAGDAVARGVIPAEPRADLLELTIDLVPPAYLDEPVRRTTEPELRVWAGTRATFVALANTDVLDPIFVLRGESETRTRMSVDPAQLRRMELSLPLTTSGEYWIEFSDGRGRPCVDPARHRIVVRRDRAPHVAIIAPGREETPSGVVDVTHTAWLRAVASDDIRLDGLSLVRDADGVVSRTDVLDIKALKRGEETEVGVATSDLSLEVGESLRVWFEARDNRVLLNGTSDPQIALSRELTLTRTPEVAPEGAGQVSDSPELTDTLGPAERISRSYGEDGEGGEEVESGEGYGDSDEGWGGPDSPDSKYRRAPGEGADDAAVDDGEQTPEIDAEDLVEDSAQEGAEQPGESERQSEAERQFSEELRRFNEEHRDDARELNDRSRRQQGDENTGESDSPRGQDESQQADEAGGGSDLSDTEQERPSQTDPNSIDTAPSAAKDAAESDDSQPESQDPNTAQAEDHRPEPPGDAAEETQDDRPAGEEQQPPKRDDDAKREAESEQPTAEPVSSEDQQRTDNPESSDSGKAEDQAEPKQGDAEADAEKPGSGDERPAQASQPQEKSEAAPATGSKEDQPAPGGKPEQSSNTGPPPDIEQKPGGDVIPLSRDRGVPDVAPPRQPEDNENQIEAEPPAGLESRADLTDTLELLRRGDEITDDDLDDLDWPPARKLAFVRDFERLQQAARRAGVLTEARWWQAHLQLGTADVSPGTALSDVVGVGVAGGTSVRDGLEQIAPPRQQQVAPELQALLDAYYRSLAEKRSEQDDRDAP